MHPFGAPTAQAGFQCRLIEQRMLVGPSIHAYPATQVVIACTEIPQIPSGSRFEMTGGRLQQRRDRTELEAAACTLSPTRLQPDQAPGPHAGC